MGQAANGFFFIGEHLPLWSVIPFAGMLLSIALFPLLAPRFWHGHFGKVAAFWSLAALAPMLILYGRAAMTGFLSVMINEYVPFVILLGGLYSVSGGILLTGALRGTPATNTAVLAAGTVLASLMGTTGAAMLLVRPLLRANLHRSSKAFIIVFFIFLVANIGGALTPLGDPPLFLGFLMGVPFLWSLHIAPHMIFSAGLLLAVFYFLDRHHYRKEGMQKNAPAEKNPPPFGIRGGWNLAFLAGITGAVLFSGYARLGEISFSGLSISVQGVIRDAAIVIIMILSMALTPEAIREENNFTWFPLKEVAILFAAIFITMTPCLDMLEAGASGRLGFIMNSLREPYHYFWATGILSSFLDNAPTYAAFLKAALGGFYPGMSGAHAVPMLIREHPAWLEAVSAGAVFFGAFTYIGNAPNFMVRSISEEAGVRMPGFAGYVIKYSLPVLVPVFALVTLIFF
ncbi:MAG: sodium:proton antiporter [Nitrospiraceae bacterium]|nr:sodium:proton antiporter [Nitrospiraceae bacterium]